MGEGALAHKIFKGGGNVIPGLITTVLREAKDCSHSRDVSTKDKATTKALVKTTNSLILRRHFIMNTFNRKISISKIIKIKLIKQNHTKINYLQAITKTNLTKIKT